MGAQGGLLLGKKSCNKGCNRRATHVDYTFVMANELHTVPDIAAHLGVDRSTVHRRIAAAGIEPTVIAGRTRLFDLDAVAALFTTEEVGR